MALATALAVAGLVVTPQGHIVAIGLVVLVVVGFFVVAPPDLVVGASLLVFATYQLSDLHPLQVGPVNVFTTDLLLLPLLIRALQPRPRLRSTLRLNPVIVAGIAVLVLAFANAALVGHSSGTSIDSLVRMSMILVYFPLYFFAFSRILREQNLRLDRLYFIAIFVGISLILYMLASRIAGTPFDQDIDLKTNSQGTKVVSADGTILRRDYGFPSAFILYPLLALFALSHAAYARVRTRWTTLLVVTASAATLLTLIRGEIFGLFLGAAAVYFAAPRPKSESARRRGQSLVAIAGLSVIVAFIMSATSPTLASGIAQRALPGLTPESRYAEQTADFRLRALSAGWKTGVTHPLGVGFRDAERLESTTHLDPMYVTHSTPAWLIVFTGWPGLVGAAVVFAGSLVASFRAPTREAWHHPAFVAIVCFFMVYSFSTFGIVGQPWVIGIAAMLTALRFGSGGRTAQ